MSFKDWVRLNTLNFNTTQGTISLCCLTSVIYRIYNRFFGAEFSSEVLIKMYKRSNKLILIYQIKERNIVLSYKPYTRLQIKFMSTLKMDKFGQHFARFTKVNVNGESERVLKHIDSLRYTEQICYCQRFFVGFPLIYFWINYARNSPSFHLSLPLRQLSLSARLYVCVCISLFFVCLSVLPPPCFSASITSWKGMPPSIIWSLMGTWISRHSKCYWKMRPIYPWMNRSLWGTNVEIGSKKEESSLLRRGAVRSILVRKDWWERSIKIFAPKVMLDRHLLAEIRERDRSKFLHRRLC